METDRGRVGSADLGARLLLCEDDQTTCVWNACDPYTTAAVRGVEGTGQASNCGRTNKDGIDFVKGVRPGFERYLALYQTPQEHGGCQGCRFFLMCKGQCPGTSMAGDWRNRSEHCEVWKGLFRSVEDGLLDEGLVPVSASPQRTELEGMFLASWAAGANHTIAAARQALERGMHVSELVAASGRGDVAHGDSDAHGDAPHGDVPHGDA